MDTQLVMRAQEGDEAAFASLTEALAGRLARVAYGILRDRALADDATQQAFINMWRKLPRLRDPQRFEAWAHSILVRACSDEVRRSRRALPPTSPVAEPVAHDELGGVIQRDQLERAFARLSVDHRAVIVLHHYFDLSLPATADALDISVGTAKSRLHRAMEKLRLAMAADMPATTDQAGEVAR